MKIKIAADSTCDLSPELVEKYDISVLPLYVTLGDRALADGVEVSPEDIYAHVAASGKTPSTSAISVAEYEEFFRKQLADCDALVHFHISQSMSCCYQNALIAAEGLEVYPVDSANLSTGIGLLVLEAAELAREGKLTAKEIQAEMDRRKEKLDVSFVVDTLEYLRKGGRCTALAALGANLLSLKPCIEVHDGAMGVGKKYRGTLQKCVLQYVRERMENRDDIDTRRIFITESGGYSEEQIEAVRAELMKYQPFEEILHTRAGCTVSSHCGPGTLGILYFHK